jgi:hypothetical protein
MAIVVPPPNTVYPDDTEGPCPWPLDTACCPGWPEDPEEWDDQHVLAVEIATDILWRLTAGRFGLCPELIRPCRRACTPDGSAPAICGTTV